MSSLVVLLALSEQARAADIAVPTDEPTIAAAIAVARPTDTIVLEAINLTEDIVLNGVDRTIVGAVAGNTLTGSITVRNGASLTLADITLAGGAIETDLVQISNGNLCESRGPGISVLDSDITLDHVTVQCYSPGMYLENSTASVGSRSFFRYNQDNVYAGGIQSVDSQLSISDSRFELNGGYQGGAVSAIEASNAGGASLHIETSSFATNTSNGGPGAGVYTRVGDTEIWATEFNNNFNFVYFTPGLNLADAVALGLDTPGVLVGLGDGAGVFVDEGSDQVDIWNNTFCGNISDTGGGLYIANVDDVQVYNNRFADNWAAHYGGAFYVQADANFQNPVAIVNNTILYNTAGKLPPPDDNVIVALGAGGGGAFVNTVADFRNNVVALTRFGAGLMGVAQDLGVTLGNGADPDYTIGDLLAIDYNDFYLNCDATNCDESTAVDFSGDLSQISLPATNIQLNPFPVYFGGGDFNCLPDAFYPEFTSPIVRSGDAANEPNRYSPNFSDMGAFGGPRADVLDRDGDGYENIYDCNDEPGGGSVHPGAAEACDGFDNDCDGQIDEGFDTVWYPDVDGDGYGDVTQVQPVIQCTPPRDHVLNRDDCDDNDPDINPSNSEICDNLDNDCDGAVDGNLDFIPLYRDNDGDGYGFASSQVNGCTAQDANAGPGVYYVLQPDGSEVLSIGVYVTNADDCDDNDPNTNPNAVDTCDTKDNDCDGIVDNDGGDPYYPDVDGDGFGDMDATDDQILNACADPGRGWSPQGTDCDDGDPAVNPDADEVCDQKDNDCDGRADKDSLDAPVVYEDLDGDGLGNPARPSTDCVPPAGYTATKGTDCDDADANVGECAECGCQSTPTGGSVGAFGLVMAFALGGLRRRRS